MTLSRPKRPLTYARRSRNPAGLNCKSLQILKLPLVSPVSVDEVQTRSEMVRRMTKRARHSSSILAQEKSHAAALHTPHPSQLSASLAFKLASSGPTTSPPPAIPRATSSRSLKENNLCTVGAAHPKFQSYVQRKNFSSKVLASPFTSRPSSPSSSSPLAGNLGGASGGRDNDPTKSTIPGKHSDVFRPQAQSTSSSPVQEQPASIATRRPSAPSASRPNTMWFMHQVSHLAPPKHVSPNLACTQKLLGSAYTQPSCAYMNIQDSDCSFNLDSDFLSSSLGGIDFNRPPSQLSMYQSLDGEDSICDISIRKLPSASFGNDARAISTPSRCTHTIGRDKANRKPIELGLSLGDISPVRRTRGKSVSLPASPFAVSRSISPRLSMACASAGCVSTQKEGTSGTVHSTWITDSLISPPTNRLKNPHDNEAREIVSQEAIVDQNNLSNENVDKYGFGNILDGLEARHNRNNGDCGCGRSVHCEVVDIGGKCVCVESPPKRDKTNNRSRDEPVTAVTANRIRSNKAVRSRSGTITAPRARSGSITSAKTVLVARTRSGTITTTRSRSGTIIASRVRSGTITATRVSSGSILSTATSVFALPGSDNISKDINSVFNAACSEEYDAHPNLYDDAEDADSTFSPSTDPLNIGTFTWSVVEEPPSPPTQKYAQRSNDCRSLEKGKDAERHARKNTKSNRALTNQISTGINQEKGSSKNRKKETRMYVFDIREDDDDGKDDELLLKPRNTPTWDVD